MKNFLVYRTRIWKLGNSNRKSSKEICTVIFIKKGVLYRSMVDNGHKFEAAMVPEDLIGMVLHLGHISLDIMDTKELMPQSSMSTIGKGWENMHWFIVKNCPTCAKQKVQKTQFEKQIFEPGVQPMEFVCIDLIGEFYPPSSKGNRYTLTAVCMLTGFTFCIPSRIKQHKRLLQPGEIIFCSRWVSAESYWWTMHGV